MRIRSLMTSSLLACLLALAALAPSGSAQTIPVQPQPGPGISVVGTGIVLADPDVVRATLGVDVFDTSLANAQAQAARSMDAVVSKLKADGIAESDIRTVSFDVSPQYDQQNNQQVLRGFRVQNLVDVRSTNVAGFGSLLDDVVSSGATRIYGISFESSDMQSIKSQARDQAMADARARAEQLARDAGVALGRPVLVQETESGGVVPVRANVAPAAAAAPATPIQPGQLQVSTTVQVTWAIQ